MELPPKHVRFTHTPLNFQNKEIRLITIEPSSDPSSPIEITMENVDFSGPSNALARYREKMVERRARGGQGEVLDLLDEFLQGTLKFIALSYTWGPELPAQEILVTSSECRGWLSIRQNLYEFLKMRRGCLSGPQNSDESSEMELDLGPASFWIDQICINQEKDDEKAHQVNQMADIYSAAFMVEVWLGSGFEGSDELADLIVHESGLSGYTYMFSVNEQKTRTIIPSLCQFVRLPYWSRLWVTQEIILGRIVRMRIGSKTFLWPTFYTGWRRLLGAWETLCNIEQDEDVVSHRAITCRRIQEIAYRRRELNLDWSSVWHLVSGTECLNLRDRAFGMMGMLKPSLRVFPDYSMQPQDILLKLLTKQVGSLYDHVYVGFDERLKFWRVRRDCVKTAANWLPQLEDDTHKINPKTVRRHIFSILLWDSQPASYAYRQGRFQFYMQDEWDMSLEKSTTLSRFVLWNSLEPVYRIGQKWKGRYTIWRDIPNRRNILWRIVHADYKRFAGISNHSPDTTYYSDHVIFPE
jgi:hypothetical protein